MRHLKYINTTTDRLDHVCTATEKVRARYTVKLGFHRYYILVFVINLFFMRLSVAETVALYSDGQPNPKYSELVWKLKPGDVVVFDGISHEIGKKLGSGSSDSVFEMARPDRDQKLAIRIPNRPASPISTGYLIAYPLLSENGVALPVVRTDLSVKGKFIIVHLENVQFTLEKLLTDNPDFPYSRDPEWVHLRERLKVFAQSTHRFAFINDLRPSNIAWNGVDWILLDWSDGRGPEANQLIRSHDDRETTFRSSHLENTEHIGLIEDLVRLMERAVRLVRETAKSKVCAQTATEISVAN